MQLVLSKEVETLLEERMRAGRFTTPEEAVVAGLRALQRQQEEGDFKPGEMERLLEEGEQSGAPLDGEAVLAELRSLRDRG